MEQREIIKRIKKYYTDGFWSISRVDKLFELGYISDEEYNYIIGQE